MDEYDGEMPHDLDSAIHLRNKLWQQGEDESATQTSNVHDQFVDFFPNGNAKITLPINLYRKRNKLWE